MLQEIQNEIETLLNQIPELQEVDAWTGEIADILQKPKKMPSAHVIYQGASFLDRVTINTTKAKHTPQYNIVIVNKNLRSRKDAIGDVYTIIEAIREKLIGYKTDYGCLWPLSETVVAVDNGIVVYGMLYEIKEIDTE